LARVHAKQLVELVGKATVILMKRLLPVLCTIVLSTQLTALAVGQQKPVIRVVGSVTTSGGVPREFSGPAGTIAWSPCLPMYPGDVLKLDYSISGPSPSHVSISVDGRAIADLHKEPWSATIYSTGLSIGRHMAKADLRFPGNPIMYSISEFPFYIQAPPSAVKGVVESLSGDVRTSSAEPEAYIPAMIGPPAASSIDSSFQVRLCSLDSTVTDSLVRGQVIHITKPTSLLIADSSRLDRWAYVITRDGRQIAAGGPMRTSVYLMIVPQTVGGSGFLPGEIVVKAWGVTSSGKFSRPVEATLVIEKQ
jgi:hypothetical protein